MISASKSTLSLNNLKILRSKVTKNLTILPKKFCEYPPRYFLLGNVILLPICMFLLFRPSKPLDKKLKFSIMVNFLDLFLQSNLYTGQLIREYIRNLSFASCISWGDKMDLNDHLILGLYLLIPRIPQKYHLLQKRSKLTRKLSSNFVSMPKFSLNLWHTPYLRLLS